MKPLFAIIAFTIFATNLSFAQDASKRSENFNLQRGIAIKGYDPIEFFNQDRAVQANGTISYEYNGVKYFFTSTKNLAQFKSTPTKFEPQYGGWCAYNMSKDGSRVAGNPQHFSILDGKLYFFASDNEKMTWLKEKNALKDEADNYWSVVMD